MNKIMNYKYKLIVGLGNPGRDYKTTYHNAGLLFLDRLAAKSEFKTYKNFEYAKIGDTVVVKPLIFMNESGEAVKSALKHFKKEESDLFVIHDDSDIEIGNYKISKERGSAGHRGVESVINSLGTNDFVRLRLGIRKGVEGGKRLKAEDLVLKKISKADLLSLEGAFEKAAKEIID